jgi:hypothetical protein
LTPVLEAALTYAARGWAVVPIGAGAKYPDLEAWQDQATTDPTVIGQWYTQRPGRGVGIATGHASGIFVLDVDVAHGKDGDESLRILEEQHGPLPATVEAITGSGGRHLFFRLPPGVEISNSAGRLGPDLDIRANGGQVVAAPTIHPDTGQPYAWDLEHHPAEHPIADAPPWLIELLRAPAKVERPTGPRPSLDQAVLARERFNLHPQTDGHVTQLLEQAGWTEGRPDRHGVRYFTRPGKDRGISASLGKVAPGVLMVFTSSAPPLEAERAYDPFDVYRLLAHGGDAETADAALVAAGWGVSSYGADLRPLGPVKAGAPASPDGHPLHLPDAFWTARPSLTWVRQAAHSRLMSADAVLGALLVRVAAMTDHTVEIPAIVGKPVGLTFFTAPVGPPSAGKSAAAGIAAELIPVPMGAKVLDRLPVGSGEGFVECLFDWVTEEEDGKKIKVKKQTRYAAIFHIDEGTILGDLGQRSGSTIMPTLRSAFTHDTLGSTNASAERKRLLRGHEYVYGVTMGIQPEKAGDLLGDKAAGTPQRFLWLMATDPTIPDADLPWPGPLGWTPPSSTQLDPLRPVHGYRRASIPVAPEVIAEVRAERRRNARGGHVDDAEAHLHLLRLKTAALLAILDQRVELRADDWGLAGIAVDTSLAVRRWVESQLATAQAKADETRALRDAKKAAIIEAVSGQRAGEAVDVACRSAATTARSHAEAASHPHRGCSRGCFRKGLNSAYRPLVNWDEVVELALEQGWIVADAGSFRPGPSRPS